jgi:hypothetical protein
LPAGSQVNLGYCTPKAKIAGAACVREADCTADQGCRSVGPRTMLFTCQPGAGPKSVGDACAAPAECRSGQCFDRELHAGANRAFCAATCGKSSDCAADQRCTRVLVSNNGTPADPRDDVVVGLCQTLFVPVADDGCHADGDCGVGRTCSTKYGLCYTAGAPSGAACAANEDCELNAFCTQDPSFPGGYCQSYGCAPDAAPGSVDSCPGGARATCARRGADAPLYACYEGCAKSSDCSRTSELYVCAMPVPGSAGGDGGASEAGAGDGAASDGGAGDASDAAGEAGQLPSVCLYNKGV